ncbi:putative ABC transporter ATP-binding protein [bacterium HR23]|nr:putative ABC transporter ATP-binding protein [bacterium HR23]
MRVLWRLMTFAWPQRWSLLLALVCGLGASLFGVAVPRLLGLTIDRALAQAGVAALVLLAGGVLGASLLRGLLSFGQTYLAEKVSQQVAYRLRNLLLDTLHRLSFAYHDRQQTGALMSRATVDVEGVRWFISMGLVRAVSLLVLVVGAVVVLVATNWRMALVVVAFAPFVAWRATVTARALREVWQRTQEGMARMTTVLQENLQGAKVVRAFASAPYEEAKFNATAQEVASLALTSTRLQASNASQMALAFGLAGGVLLLVGVGEVQAGRLTPGGVAQAFFYMGLITMPLRMVGWVVNTFTRAVASGERIFAVLDTPSPVQERPHPVHLGRARGHLRFEGVWFSYGGKPVLRGITFEARPGEVVALAGPAGSGKSTLVHLIPRFYDVSQGRITLDGIDIRDLSLESLRRNVGIVLQDTFLFSATIRENIAYGKPNATLEEVVRSAQVAQLHDFILSLPQGYDTWVGERGVTLSGGQRQRLAIARVLLLDPPVLVLDDATSSVDAETEERLQEAMERVMEGRTVIVIAHRLSTLRRADRILVLQDGRIVQEGSHDQLLVQEGPYRQLVQGQLLGDETGEKVKAHAQG